MMLGIHEIRRTSSCVLAFLIQYTNTRTTILVGVEVTRLV
jgi:hypothetical protein